MPSRDVLKGLLYAKWRLTDPEIDPRKWAMPRGPMVESHLQETLYANAWLLKDSSFGLRLWTVMGLQKVISYPEFAKLCRIAVLLHDIGKVNDEFQEMMGSLEAWYLREIQVGLRKKLDDAGWLEHGRKMYAILNNPDDPDSPRYTQKFRHEIASFLWFTSEPERLEWLFQVAGGKENSRLILAAVLGHHRKTNQQFKGTEFDTAAFSFPNGKVETILDNLATELRLSLPPLPRVNTKRYSFKAVWKKVKRILHPEKDNRILETALSRAIKFVTVLSDVYGSMTPQNGYPGGFDAYRQELKESLLQVLTVKPYALTEKQVKANIRANLREFQKIALNTIGNALTVVGCGGGKTVGGYLWAADENYICTDNIIFTEVMTGAAAQIFVDTADTEIGTLRTSRADLDLELLKTPEEKAREALLLESALGGDLDEEAPVQDLRNSFERMLHPLTLCTVDQLLGVITNRQPAILWLPYIVNSRVIFDEFDAFDRRMLGAFEKFLEWFPGIKVHGMSATVPKDLEILLRKYRPDLTVIESTGADDPSFAPRYRFHRITRERADALFTLEKRTLWIVNLVKVCQNIGVAHPEAIVFHAKFPYVKKRQRQGQLVDSFRDKKKGVLAPVKAICTSVVGSSINIFGNRMIFEVCPPGEGVQRVGRASERGEIPKEITDIYFYTPESHMPYSSEHFCGYDEWYDELLGKVWSYKELVDHYRDTWKGKEIIPVDLDIFDTRVLRLREAASKTALLECELPEIKEALKEAKSGKERALILQGHEFSTYADKDKYPEYARRIVVKGTFDERLGILEG